MIKNRKKYILLISAILIFLAMELPFIVDVRPVMVDEAWYGNTGYNIANGEGFTNSVVGSGGNSNFIAPTIIAFMMCIFGESLFAIRVAAVFCGMLTLIVIHMIMNHLNYSIKSRIVGYGLFVSITILNSVFRYGRPEFAALFFIALGILGYLKYFDNRCWKNMAILSISVIFAACSHPYCLLLFAIIGLSIVFEAIVQKRPFENYLHLFVLALAAFAAMALMFIVGAKFNIVPSTSTAFFSRLGGENILVSILIYVKEVFLSKHCYITIPGFIFVIFSAFRSKTQSIRSLAIITVAFMSIFPILFAADTNMLGNAAEFFALLLIVIISSQYNDFDKNSKSRTLNTAVFYSMLMICVFFCTLTAYFNFKVKYEKTNSILINEINKIIPDNSLVFGSIRLWPCKMHSRYYSDHSRYASLPDSFDYIVTNEQDLAKYDIYSSVMEDLQDYILVYQKDTKQYGRVNVYKYHNYD